MIRLQNKWVIILVLMLGFFGGEALAQTTYTWIGGNGSWATSTNWSPTRTTAAATDILQFNDGGTYTVTNVPTQTIRQLSITSNSDITLTSTGTVTLSLNFPVAASNALVIASGSKLTMGSSTITNLSIITTTTQRGDISGELVMANGTFTTSAITAAPGVTVTGAITNNNGTITSSANSLNFASGSFYNHARNGGAIPTATWNAASTINVTGITTTAVTFTGTFGNITWNCPSQTLLTAGFTAGSTINGTVQVDAGRLNVPGAVFTFNGPVNIGVDGTLSFNSATSLKTFNGVVTIDGAWIETAGTAITYTNDFTNNGTFTSSTGVHTFNGTAKTIHTTVPTTINSVTITGSWTNTSTVGFYVGTTFAGGGTLTAASGSVLGFGGASFTAPTLAITANPNTFVYNGTGAQTIRAITYHNLEINKPVGILANASTNFTVNNDITVTSGILNVSGTAITITGNAGGTFSMTADGVFSTVRTTAPFFPTNITNYSLDNLSTIRYASTTAFTLPLLSTLPISQYPILGTAGSNVIRTLPEATTVYGLNLEVGTLSDNGFQITANAAGPITMASGTGLTLGTTATATQFPLNAVNANISLNTGSTVTYNSNQATVISGEPTYGALTLTATTATVKTLADDVTVMGTMTIGLNNTLDVDGHTLSLAAGLTNSGTSAILTANAPTSRIRLIGGSSQTINMGSNLTGGLVSTLEVEKTGGTATLSTASFDVNDLNIIAGTLSNGSVTIGIRNNYSNTGTFTVNSGGAVAFNGTSAQTFDIGTYTGNLLASLIINNPAGVTLTAPLNVTTLTLTDGILSTDATNILQVNGTTAANIVGGSSTSYVNGPMRRLLPNGASVVSFVFPVGKSGYNPFVLNSPTTNASTVVITAEVFDAVAGGTDATGFSSGSPAPAHYWQASATTSPANLTAIGSIRLQDNGMTITADNAIGRSATQTGVYSNFGGSNPNSPATGDITTTIAVPTALGFFKIGEKGSLCGTYTVGTGGDFATLTEAVSVLNGANVTCDVIFELTTNYTGSGESFPIVFNNLSYTGGPWDVTIRPSSSVSSTITIAGDPGSTLPLFDFEGVDYLTIDGVPGGSTGSNVIADSRLRLRNTRTAATVGPTVLFDNDATNNTLKYLQVEGQNVATNSATIVFGATATATGNENNTIAYCLLPGRTDVSATHRIAIYSVGSTTAGLGNDNITIANCNIADFWAASSTVAGIYLGNGNSDWTITDNSFYQTASRTQTGASSHYGIFLSNSTGTNFTVSGNYIGGSQALAGGSTWTCLGLTSNNANTFVGISLNPSTSSTNVIEDNVITNMVWRCTGTSAVLPGIWTGIHAASNGGFTIDGNTIGAETGTGTITISTGTTGGNSYGIGHNTSSGTITITNNKVGGIIANGTTTALSHNFTGIIYGQAGSSSSRIISGNLVGSLTTANSISVGSSSSTTAQSLIGIDMSTGANAVEISDNTVANLTNTYTSSGASLTIGIRSPFAVNTMTGNTVFNLTSNASTAGTGVSAAVSGIAINASSASGHTVSNNTVHSISNTTASTAVQVNGIYFNPASSTSSSNTVSNNLVHSIWATSSSATASVFGIQIAGGTSTINNVNNNMIRLGIKADGTDHNTGNLVYGLYELNGTNNVLHNSIYIGGAGTLNANSFAYFTNPTNTTRNVQNNIFVNARSSTSGTGKHYAIRVGGFTNLTSNYNDLYVTGTNGFIGLNGTTDYADLAAWQSTGEGANSISGDPAFIDPTGDAGDVDLHIQPAPATTPIEGIGNGSATTSTDIDGDDRSTFSPTDMGADAGDFGGVDLTTPAISFTDISGVCNSATTHTLSGVNISDASGVNVTAGTAPRIYYKKSTDANDNTGWKYVESTTGSSPFTFNIDFSLLNAGSVSPGDVLQYFVVAQDLAPTPNVGITSGSFDAQPASVALGSTAFPIGGTIKEFSILPCSGTVTVGTGGNYPSLTNPGGLFQAINAATLSGNLVANIVSDLTLETGTHPLNEFAAPFTVTIQADGTTQRLIASTTAATTGLIRLVGADRATFNGGTGTDRLLVFRNTITNNAGANTFSFSGDASNNTINNCIIEGAPLSTGNGVISFGTGVSTGNDNNLITNCDISDNGTTPYNAIYSVGTGTTAINNSGNTISNCNISDYHHPSGVSTGILLGAGNNSWTIQDNHFFQTASRTAAAGIHSAININNNVSGQGGFVITGNYIGGSAADGSGTMTYTSTAAAQYAPIYLIGVPSAPASSVTDNTIKNISVSTISASTSGVGMFTGIYLGATAASWAVTGNTIGDATATGSISITLNTNSGGFAFGIRSESTGSPNISDNTIAGISVSATGSNANAYLHGINFNAGSVTADNNTIGSATTSNSLLVTATATTNPGNIIGISGTSSALYTVDVTNNQILNLRHNSTSTATQAIGITCSGGGQYDIAGNLVRSLSTSSGNTGNGTSSSVLGISLNTGNTSGCTVDRNTVSEIGNTGTAAATVTGIYYSAGSNSGNTLSRNFVHSLTPTTSTSASASVTGMFVGGPVTAANNMIRLGIDASGASITTAQPINGISLSNTTGSTNVYFNTVYIGGSGVGTATTGTTVAFRRISTSGTHNFRNNIFVNARSNASTGSKHYAYLIANTTGVTSDYNLFHAPGTGGVLFSINNGSTDITTLAALQSGGGQNTNSGVDDPNLVDPTGDAANVDLHITGITAADEAGIAITGIDVDFDGDDRTDPSTTPTDIGADATDATPKDITAPAISVTSVPTQAPCGGSLSIDITATVTDASSGVNTTTFPPTLWWRESTGSWASLAATSNTGNDWLFTLNLTGVTAGQTYEYYVAAQDLATTPNIGYSHGNGTTPVHANTTAAPSVTNTTPASFNVSTASPLSGTVTVGTGGTYTTLTASNGLFAAINANGLDGDLLVEVISNTTEDGNQPLYQWAEYCGSGYKVKVVPSDATVKTLSGSLIGFGLINIYASRVTFDGSFGGSGRYLKFENTYTGTGGSENNTFKFDRFSPTSLATNDTIRNCEIVGNSTKTAGGVIYLSSSCSNIHIDNNIIRGGSSWAVNIILALGAIGQNQNIAITNNEIYNFLAWSGGVSTRAYGINITNSGNGSNWTITGNSIFNTGVNGQSVQTALRFIPGSSSTGNLIANNWIGGSSAQCGTGGSVTTWQNSLNPSNTEVQIKGIEVNCGTVDIDSNNITNIWVSGSDYTGFIGMHILGSTVADVTYNVFGTGSNGQPDGSKLIQVSGGGVGGGFLPGYIYGIWNQSTTTSITTYEHNDFYYLFQSGASTGGNVHCIAHQTAGPATITSNRINGPQGSGRGWNQHGIRFEPTASTSNNLIEGNIIAGPYINSLVNGGGTTNYGINVKALSTYTHTGTISRNVVWDMRNADRSGYTQGIIVWTETGGNGTWDIKNNQVTLMNNNSTSNCVGLYGIEVDLNSASTANVEYNTVFIGGSNGGSAVSGVDFSSYAYFRLPNYSGAVTGEALTLRNNIFINWRLVSNGFVTGHFAIGNGGSATNFNTSDYNFLAVANGGASYLGYWGGATRATLANWQSASSKDANSKTATYTAGSSDFSLGELNAEDLFIDPLSDLHISIADGESYQFVDAQATPISITTDYDGDTRDGTTPDIGADEFSACATPTVSAHPTSPTICAGANTSISVTASGSGLSYAWEVNTGSTWTTVSNGGVYTNATTSTLDITGATASMSGYQYRAVITNSCGNTTSNAGTLTVNEAGAVTVNGGGTYCGSAELTATGGTGGTIYWQGTTSGGTSTTTASSSQTVSSSGTYYFRARTSGGCWGAEGSATVTILSAPNTTTVWTGDVDNDWFKWENWTNCVPGSITDVTIPAGRPNYPAVYGANPVANSVTIQTGGSMTLNGGRTLVNTDYINNQGTLTMSAASIIQLGGNWTNTGTFNSGNGTVEFTGTATSTVNGGGTGSTQAFNNILVTKTGGAKVTLSGDVKTNGLEVTTGEFEVPAGRQALPSNVINNTNGVIRVKSSGQLRVAP